MTKIIKDQTFRLFNDNRREMIFPIEMKEKIGYDFSKNIIDSKPLMNINHCKSLRFISKFPITMPFNKHNANRAQTRYKNDYELVIRNFIKAYYSKNEKLGLKGTEFRTVQDLIDFIYGICSNNERKSLKVSASSISRLKNRQLIWKPVEATGETLQLVERIKYKFPDLRADLFLKPIT